MHVWGYRLFRIEAAVVFVLPAGSSAVYLSWGLLQQCINMYVLLDSTCTYFSILLTEDVAWLRWYCANVSTSLPSFCGFYIKYVNFKIEEWPSGWDALSLNMILLYKGWSTLNKRYTTPCSRNLVSLLFLHSVSDLLIEGVFRPNPGWGRLTFFKSCNVSRQNPVRYNFMRLAFPMWKPTTFLLTWVIRFEMQWLIILPSPNTFQLIRPAGDCY